MCIRDSARPGFDRFGRRNHVVLAVLRALRRRGAGRAQQHGDDNDTPHADLLGHLPACIQAPADFANGDFAGGKGVCLAAARG